MLRSIIYMPSPPSLQILDQLTLPHQEVYLPITSATAAWHAIARMQVRGAPAIALVAALALAVELHAAHLADETDERAFPPTDTSTTNTNVAAEEYAATSTNTDASNTSNTSTGTGTVETHIHDPAIALGIITAKLEYLVTARPTAVNLADAARRLGAGVRRVAEREGATARMVFAAYVRAAGEMLAEDVRVNERIGEEGARWILEMEGKKRKQRRMMMRMRIRQEVVGACEGTEAEEAEEETAKKEKVKGEIAEKQEKIAEQDEDFKISVLTHCNTGSLATAGYGTALGIIRSLHAAHRLSHVYYTETRPYHQGSRLTGLELLHDGIPATLVTDSAAAALLAGAHASSTSSASSISSLSSSSTSAPPPPCAVIVGADRVARNGDTANKVGTYALAVLARWHGATFLVAAPRTTIDVRTPDGRGVIVEQRAAREMVAVRGPMLRPTTTTTTTEKRVGDGGFDVEVDVEQVVEVSVAPMGTRVWNPAFDVTPAALIDGIVTEVGVVEKVGETFDLEAIMKL